MKDKMLRFASSVAAVTLLVSGPSSSFCDSVDPDGFEIITVDSFEGKTVIETLLETELAPNTSVSSGGVSVVAISDTSTNVTISTAVSQDGIPRLLVELSGGDVAIEVDELPSLSSTAGEPSLVVSWTCPDVSDGSYPVKFCWKAYTARFVDVFVGKPIPIDYVLGARVPGDGSSLSESGSNSLFRSYELYSGVSANLVSVCESLQECTGQPVLLIHGFQKEAKGVNLEDNGGRDHWGYFPDRLKSAGLLPFEFKWLTNARFEDVAQDLKDAIIYIEANTGRQVHLVAHSMGGMLVRRLLQDTPTSEVVASLIASVSVVGTPHLGIFPEQTTLSGITFPEGQDKHYLFNGCGQISCHILGENVFGSFISNLLIPGSPEIGSEAVFIAKSVGVLPELSIQSLIGFTREVEDDGFIVNNGDRLLTSKTQRFLPEFLSPEPPLPWQVYRIEYQINDNKAKLSEFALGRESALDLNLELYPYQLAGEVDFEPYRHSTGTPERHPPSPVTQPYAPENAYHDTYQRVVDWIADNTPPPPPPPPPPKQVLLNDTGIDWGGSYSSGNNQTCIGETIAAQDCSIGRDFTSNDDSDGHAGFLFTKLDGSGVDLPNSASSWSCVRDEVTGLTWEVKTNNGGLRDTDNTYTWVNVDSSNNGGILGRLDGGDCPGTWCDTAGYVWDINNGLVQPLCGARDWRIPSREELRSIYDYGLATGIDPNYFPNERSYGIVWTESTWASDPTQAWVLVFGSTSLADSPEYKSNARRVRLVRGGN